MSTAGLGFVGLGRAAGRLADAARLLPNGRPVAACSTDRAKAAEFASKHAIPKSYESYGAMLADPEVTGVVIASANIAHESQAAQAAAAGKHVFCEKPAGRNGTEAAGIVAACQRASVVFGVGYHLRYHPLLRQAREAVARGDLGTLGLVRAHFYTGPQYDRSGWRSDFAQSGGGALVSTGVHVIDAFNYVLDDGVAKASMSCDSLPVEEVCSVMLSFRSGAFGMFDTSRVIPNAQGSNDLELYGTRGRCRLSNVLGGPVPNGSGFIENDEGRVELTTDLSLNLYTEELADWIRASLCGGIPLADGAAAVATAAVMDELYKNAHVT